MSWPHSVTCAPNQGCSAKVRNWGLVFSGIEASDENNQSIWPGQNLNSVAAYGIGHTANTDRSQSITENVLTTGVAGIDITSPPLSQRMQSAMRRVKGAEGIESNLLATTLVLADNDNKFEIGLNDSQWTVPKRKRRINYGAYCIPIGRQRRL